MPHPTLEESTRDVVMYSPLIRQAAETFQVDPVVIAGVIFTEQTLNRNPANFFEDYYVRTYLLSLPENELRNQFENTKERLASRKKESTAAADTDFRTSNPFTWSLGVAQVSILTAIEMERELHVFESRPQRDIKAILNALLNPEDNLHYCAFELRRNKRIYSAITGINIDDRPDIQASVYNIGNARRLANRTVTEGRNPIPNEFGLYMLEHVAQIQSALKKETEGSRKPDEPSL